MAAGEQHPAPPDPPRGRPAAHTIGCDCGGRQCRRRAARLPAPHGVALTGAAAAPTDDTDDDR